MATSLESQLIEGAYWAAAKDPENLVGKAKEAAFEEGKKSVESIVGAITAGKKAKQDKIDTQTKQYDADWKGITDDMDKNLGSLDVGYWQKADDHVSSVLRPEYDACPLGNEGNRCRMEAKIKLNQFVTETADAKGAITSLKEKQSKMDGTHPEGSELDLSNSQTFEQKAILGQLDGAHASLGGINDTKISELEAQKDALVGKKGMLREDVDQTTEKARIQKEIDALKKNNPMAYGWDISYENEDGVIIDKRITKDMLPDLLPHQASDVKLEFGDQTNEALETAKLYIKGDPNGKEFDFDTAAASYGDLITPDNMKSVFKDPLYGGKETIEDHLREHPVFTGMTYSGLGIKKVGEDDIIDPEEWAAIDKLNPEDVDKIINEISNNKDLAVDIGGKYMALKAQQAVNKLKYGNDFYKLDPAARKERIKERTDPTLYDDKRAAMEAGLVFGTLVGKGEEWSEKAGTYVKKAPYSGSAADIVAGILGE